MHSDYLTRMANDIGQFFTSDASPEEAARSILTHIKRFWDPRMRGEIIAHYRAGGSDLEGPVRTAIQLLAEEAAAKGK
jgi:formate dehydrogenase subunit delta